MWKLNLLLMSCSFSAWLLLHDPYEDLISFGAMGLVATVNFSALTYSIIKTKKTSRWNCLIFAISATLLSFLMSNDANMQRKAANRQVASANCADVQNITKKGVAIDRIWTKQSDSIYYGHSPHYGASISLGLYVYGEKYKLRGDGSLGGGIEKFIICKDGEGKVDGGE